MAMNPLQLMKLKDRFSIFQKQHPRVVPFFKSIGNGKVKEGSIVELKVTDPEGNEYRTNIRISKEDLETIEMLKSL